jgi:hypothetical protein
MSEQTPGAKPPSSPGAPGSGGNNNNRRHHNQRRRPPGPNPNNPNQQGAQQGQRPQGQQQGQHQGQQGQQAQPGQPRPPGQGGGNNNRRRHRGGQNRNKNPNPNQQPGHSQNSQAQQPGGFNLERIYEKYLNLLDQHLIARRKYHDMFYRADNNQKNKLERNFYNTLNDIREFENKLAPEARELFEKRNNGLRPDNIYTTNHDITEVGEVPGPDAPPEDPHFLQSQKSADYSGDTEESVGNADDYLRYKNLL